LVKTWHSQQHQLALVKKQPTTTDTKTKSREIQRKKRSDHEQTVSIKTTNITGVKAFAFGLGLNDDAFTLSLFPVAEVGERGTEPVPAPPTAAGLVDLVKFPLDAGVTVPVAAGDPFEDTVVCPCPGVEVVIVFPFPPL